MNTASTKNEYSRREGPITRAIEAQTSKLPSDLFLWGAGLSIIGSLAFQAMQPKPSRFLNVPSRRGQVSLFIGQWAPTILLLGLYNKVVKIAGSDQRHTTG